MKTAPFVYQVNSNLILTRYFAGSFAGTLLVDLFRWDESSKFFSDLVRKTISRLEIS